MITTLVDLRSRYQATVSHAFLRVHRGNMTEHVMEYVIHALASHVTHQYFSTN
jgi:hypothetical protein